MHASTPSPETDAPVDVLIVGAGPVGLALAGDLGRRGIGCRIVERSDGTIEQPRMDMVSARTMEFCRRWGIVDAVRRSDYPRDRAQDFVYVTSVAGHLLRRLEMPSMRDSRPPPYSPQHRERCPQNLFDPILRDFALSQPGVSIAYRQSLTGLDRHADGVTATVTGEDGRETRIPARFLVGCDGAGSTVRRLAGIGTRGSGALTRSTNLLVRLPGLEALHPYGDLYRFLFVGDEGIWATMVAIDGRDIWRLQAVGSPADDASATVDVDALVRRALGAPLDYEVLSVMHWTRREMVADRFRDGAIFLAGDAAHQMSPTGGFGMNTGIGDAVDLAWKLSAVIKGWGGEALLDSYEAERQPVALRNAREASENLARMTAPKPEHPLDRGTRESVDERQRFGEVLIGAMRREWFADGIHFGYRYDDSPVCVPDRDAPAPPDEPGRYIPSSIPGGRAPHAWLPDGRSTLDLFGDGYVLLEFGEAAGTAATAGFTARAIPLSIVRIEDAEIARLYERRFVLVRPDGHVAWRGDLLPEDIDSLLARVTGRAPSATASPVSRIA